MRRLILALPALLLCATLFAAEGEDVAKEPIFSPFRDNYCITGIPFNNPDGVNSETADVRFQFSVKFRPIHLGPNWKFYFAYTHKTVWNAFAFSKSSPFHDNTYMPGIYFVRGFEKGRNLTLGFEHMSNGRPYYGNPLASEGYDDYSRGMNYIYALWSRGVGDSRFFIQAKVGFGCGVGNYERHEMKFTQDLFAYYLGYVTLGYKLDKGIYGFSAQATPIWNRSIANVTAEGWVRFAEKWPRILLQFHYGFDGAMCDCVPDVMPPCHLRVGLAYTVGDIF